MILNKESPNYGQQYLVIRRIIIITRDIFIAALKHFTVLLFPTQTCSNPAHISTPKGAYNACCH